MHWVKQLFTGDAEDWVHDMFIRYGRGEFQGPVCDVQAKKDVKFKGSVEYCNAFGRLAALCGGDYKVKGALYAKTDFRDELAGIGLEFDDKSKEKKSYYVAKLDDELPGEVVAKIYEAAPYATILLDLKGGNAKLKCKAKPPKPGKEKTADFCSGTLDKSVLDELRNEILWDVGEFKTACVEHTFAIEELVYPEGMKASDARLNARRKGKAVRKVVVDGEETTTETPLEI